MNLSRFLLGLSLLTTSLVTYKFTTDPLANTNWEHVLFSVGESVGGVAGALILGLIIWAPLRFFSGADKAPEIRSFTLYAAAILVAVVIAVRFFIGTPLGKSDRLTFVSGVEKTCFSRQRIHQENSAFNDTQLREYCSCFASSLSKEISEEELKYLAAHEAFPSSLQNKSQQTSERCGQKWLDNRKESNL